ncbi:DUF3466 family protein [Shewanella nanhaiensis]|uniref:DUF3466 family protein n=1 Tax=Shewanella nanhaiensis TaxID=2864872 RepID=A0ABS7E4N5_9GAMM|nr:DUF3466 family protein [Shewanella nanhaiensis]MBW8183987.1 DUF3466 family protein [Shewanella nanhaiensis]
MKFTLDKALSLVAVGVIGALQGVQAAPVYEIKNLSEVYQSESDSAELIGTLKRTRNGYGMAVNADGKSVAVAKGKKKLSTSEEDDDGVIDIEDGIAPEEKITFSIDKPIIANNFSFIASEFDTAKPWLPVFDSVNGTTDPSETDSEKPETINSVDVYYYGINDAGVKVGSMTSKEQTAPYTGTNEDQEFWYYREFEERGFAKNAAGTEVQLLPPCTMYEKDATCNNTAGDNKVNIGGYSVAAAINSANLVTGYVGTELSNDSENRIDACVDGETYPTDVCVQIEQYPDANGNRRIIYQRRAYVWQLDETGSSVTDSKLLPLGFETTSDTVYIAQGLGLNASGVVAGRSHHKRPGYDNVSFDAFFWTPDGTDGAYQPHWVPLIEDRFQSIAYDINDSGMLVGSFRQYIEGYVRDKFFYFDTQNPEGEVVVPNDFYNALSDLGSKPKSVNNKGQVVGFIETTHEKDKPRPKAGFLFDKETTEFNNLNKILTCESKGFAKNADGAWVRNKVEVQDGTGVTLSYNQDIKVVEGNSINEDGVIVGTAFVRKPQYQYDTNGNLVIGDNGLPIFAVDGNGDPLTSFLPRMVVLQPGSGTADEAWLAANNCIDDNGEDDNYERKGAASFAWLFALPLLWLRRRFK